MQQQVDAKQQDIDRLTKQLAESRERLVETIAEVAMQRCRVSELLAKNQTIEGELQSICGDFLFSCRDLKKVRTETNPLDFFGIILPCTQDEYMAILDALQLEKECLLGQVQTLNCRLEDERTKEDALSEQMRKLNIKYSRLEFKYSINFTNIFEQNIFNDPSF